MHGAHGATKSRVGDNMQTQPGIFECVIVDKDGYWHVTTTRNSAIALLQDPHTAKVNIRVGKTLLRTYVRMSWAVKFMQHIPSKAVELTVYTKESFNRGN